jgi:hypothetical protein
MMLSAVVVLGEEALSKRENAVKELGKILESHRVAHENGDAAGVMQGFPEGLYVVQGGKVHHVANRDAAQMRDEFFKEVRLDVDNVSPPIVNASDSGDMAWAIATIEKKTFNKQTGDLVSTLRSSALVVLRLKAGKWTIDAVAETFEDVDP